MDDLALLAARAVRLERLAAVEAALVSLDLGGVLQVLDGEVVEDRGGLAGERDRGHLLERVIARVARVAREHDHGDDLGAGQDWHDRVVRADEGAAGAADGSYDLGGVQVDVSNRIARLLRDDGTAGSIAGSTLTMDAGLRRIVSNGASIVDACRMAATTPARAIGIADDVGALAPGRRADILLLDDDLRVVRVMRAGRWIT